MWDFKYSISGILITIGLALKSIEHKMGNFYLAFPPKILLLSWNIWEIPRKLYLPGQPVRRTQYCGSGMFNPDPDCCTHRIPDPKTKEKGEKNFTERMSNTWNWDPEKTNPRSTRSKRHRILVELISLLLLASLLVLNELPPGAAGFPAVNDLLLVLSFPAVVGSSHTLRSEATGLIFHRCQRYQR